MNKKFFKYVSQSIAGMIGISIYILADTFFISLNSGADGLTMLNLTLPIYGIMFAIGAMIGIGFATSYSLKKAAGQPTKDYFMQSVGWGLLTSIVFMVAGVFFPDKILALMGGSSDIVELGTSYLRIAMIAAPCFICNYSFTAFVRNDERPVVAMVASICGSAFNIVFDYIFMFPMGMGLEGAALATAISPIVTMSVCMTHYLSSKSSVGMKLSRLSFKRFLKACSLGTSAFVGEIAAAVTTLTFNMLILNIAGNTGVAAYGVIANTALVIVAFFNGISQGSQPLISQSYGSGDQKGAIKILKLALTTSIMLMVVIMAAIYWKTDSVIRIFNHENNVELRNYAFEGIRLYFLGFVFASVNIILVTYFAATDRAAVSAAGSIIRGLAGIVVWAVVLSKIMGIKGVWLSFLASEITTFIIVLGIFFFKRKRKKHNRKRENVKQKII